MLTSLYEVYYFVNLITVDVETDAEADFSFLAGARASACVLASCIMKTKKLLTDPVNEAANHENELEDQKNDS